MCRDISNEKQCCIFPVDEGADAGIDDGMPVSENHKAAKKSGFTADGGAHTCTGGRRGADGRLLRQVSGFG